MAAWRTYAFLNVAGAAHKSGNVVTPWQGGDVMKQLKAAAKTVSLVAAIRRRVDVLLIEIQINCRPPSLGSSRADRRANGQGDRLPMP
jgi:hypothetical protein